METKIGPICGVDNCRSRRYHLGPDGFDYCQNGHKRDAGPIVVDDGYHEGAASQRFNEISRAQRDKEDEASRFLDGREAVMLYLQCFQLILWKQANWLVKVKGFPQELETVIHDLWALRLQMLRALIEDPDETRASQMFSTQSETEDSGPDQAGSAKMQASMLQRAPLLIETISLCYLSLILLRIPVCSSDVSGWIISENFTYLRASQDLPRAMRQRLPLTLRIKFLARTGIGEMERFNMTMVNLTWAFKGSFGMKFPALNHHLLLFRFVTELALPLDVFGPTNDLARLLGYEFTFPLRPRRGTLLRLHQYPEIQLVSLLIVATKLLFPFDSTTVPRHPHTSTSPTTLVIDWPAWDAARTRFHATPADTARDPQRAAARRNAALLATTEADVFGMTGADADAYLAWFERTWLGGEESSEEREAALAAVGTRSTAEREFRSALFRFFPLGGPPGGEGDEEGDGGVPVEDEEEEEEEGQHEQTDGDDAAAAAAATAIAEELDPGVYDAAAQARVDRIAAVQSTLLQRHAISDAEVARQRGSGSDSEDASPNGGVWRPGSLYKLYRSFDEVPEVGRGFFADAARLVGLRVEELVTAVVQVEMKVRRWVAHQRKEENDQDAGLDPMMETPPETGDA